MVDCAIRRSPLMCTVPAERSNAVYRAREANHMHVMTHANGRDSDGREGISIHTKTGHELMRHARGAAVDGHQSACGC